MAFMSDFKAVFLGKKSSSKATELSQPDRTGEQRAPFQNIDSTANSVGAQQKSALPPMSYRAAPVVSPSKQHFERRFPESPVRAAAYHVPAQQVSDFSGPMDEQISRLHDTHGRLNPSAVQAFIDRQVQGYMGEAYAQMGALMHTADMDADAVYQATSWQPAGAYHSQPPYQASRSTSVAPHQQAAFMPTGGQYQGGPSVAPFSRTASAPPLVPASGTLAPGKAVFAM